MYSDRDENLVSNVLNEKITFNVIWIPSSLTNTEDPPRHSDFEDWPYRSVVRKQNDKKEERMVFIGSKPTSEPSMLQDWVGSEWKL